MFPFEKGTRPYFPSKADAIGVIGAFVRKGQASIHGFIQGVLAGPRRCLRRKLKLRLHTLLSHPQKEPQVPAPENKNNLGFPFKR